MIYFSYILANLFSLYLQVAANWMSDGCSINYLWYWEKKK
jgi:hypothetical protein